MTTLFRRALNALPARGARCGVAALLAAVTLVASAVAGVRASNAAPSKRPVARDAVSAIVPAAPAAATRRPTGVSRTVVAAKTPIATVGNAPPAFRLGTAARPFGWSTAIGDLDSDGTPDVAVADHVGRAGADRYAYRIALSLSSRPSADVTFESSVDAVSIRTIDVDHDNDLDIVVRRVVGGDAVGVWLNDGFGNFTSVDVHGFASALRSVVAVAAPGSPLDAAASDTSSSQGNDGVATDSRSVGLDTCNAGATALSSRAWQSALPSHSSPRAPPSRLDL